MFSLLGKQRKTKQFSLTYRYYDPAKERMQKRLQRVQQGKALETKEEAKESSLFKDRLLHSRSVRRQLHQRLIRLVVIFGVLIGLALLALHYLSKFIE